MYYDDVTIMWHGSVSYSFKTKLYFVIIKGATHEEKRHCIEASMQLFIVMIS